MLLAKRKHEKQAWTLFSSENMFTLEITSKCESQIKKHTAKNNALSKLVYNKINQILKNPEHFKQLGNILKGKRRVHISGCFVLIYEFDVNSQTVRLLRFIHHDEAY